jgi:hypothetical protein
VGVERLEDRTLLSFAAPTAFDLGAAPTAVAVGHFEGAQAPLDIATANANGTVSVLLGAGDGSVHNPILLTVGGTPMAVAVGDLLGNGLQDIAVANANGGVSVLLSHGNETFAAPASFSVGATPKGLVVGDFTGDGKLDLATANAEGTVSVLSGDGTGNFGSPITTQVGGILTSLAVGDFNGDGKADLVVGTDTGLAVLLGRGDGTFQVAASIPFVFHYANLLIPETVDAVAVSALRGTSQDIIALANGGLNVLLGHGDGTFGDRQILPAGGSVTESFVVGDFTGDGKPDIATSGSGSPFSSGPSIVLLVGQGDGTFTAFHSLALGEAGRALTAGDFRGTGKLDLVLASDQGSNTVTVLQGNGHGGFALAPTLPANVFPLAIAAADFTGDGKPDLVTTGEAGNAVVLLNNGSGAFRPGPLLTVTGTPDSVLTGDFNGDGKQDIAVGTEAGTIDVFLGKGDGTFSALDIINLGTNNGVRSLVAGDFNRDGKLDIAVTSDIVTTDQGRVTMLLGNGDGTFHVSQVVRIGTDANGLVAADFNGDGILDLATTTFLPDGSRDARVLLGQGNGTFKTAIVTTPGGSATALAAGDFNRDGKQDLVLVDSRNNTVTVLRGKGDGTFQAPLSFMFDTPARGLGQPAVANFFGDGKLSVAVSTGLGDLGVLRGNGDGTFQAPVNYVVDFNGSEPAAAVAADFNGDGKPDLAVTQFLTDDVAILRNTSPPPVIGAKEATSTVLTADVSSAVFGQPITLTATVNGAVHTPSGTVTFFDGNTPLGEVALDPNGQARLLITLGVGPHSLRARFAGLAPFSASVSSMVREPISKAATTTTISVEIHAFGSLSLVLLTATVTPVAPGAGVPTGTVTFVEGATVLGTATLDASGQAALFLENFPSGSHTVTASYGGDADFQASVSDPLTFTVPAAPSSPAGRTPLRLVANSGFDDHPGTSANLANPQTGSRQSDRSGQANPRSANQPPTVEARAQTNGSQPQRLVDWLFVSELKDSGALTDLLVWAWLSRSTL